MRKNTETFSQQVIPISDRTSEGAAALSPEKRKGLAIKVLSRTDSITSIATEHNISRKFLYKQLSCRRQSS